MTKYEDSEQKRFYVDGRNFEESAANLRLTSDQRMLSLKFRETHVVFAVVLQPSLNEEFIEWTDPLSNDGGSGVGSSGAGTQGGTTGGSGTGSGSGSGGGSSLTSHRIFVTIGSWYADFGGLSVADGHCQTEGNNIDSSSRWVAILSDEATSAKDRVQINGIVYKMQGTTQYDIAQSATELWSGNIDYAVDTSWDGTPTQLSSVWTGSDHTGTKTGSACYEWTVKNFGGGNTAEGRTNTSGPTWLSANATCGAVGGGKGFYCIQQ